MPFPTATPDWTSYGSRRSGNRTVNFYEENAEYNVEVEIPGYDPDNITLTWHEGRLTVSVSHAGEETGRSRTFHRTFWVPKEVDSDGITARYRNGVLTVTLPIEGEGSPYGEEIEVKT